MRKPAFASAKENAPLFSLHRWCSPSTSYTRNFKFKPSSVVVKHCLCLNWSYSPKTGGFHNAAHFKSRVCL